MSSTERGLPRSVLGDEGLPLYVQVAVRLRDDLVAGAARAGDRLPSERVLAERYAVSRVTLRSALAELADRGYLRSSAARGWFVHDLPAHRVDEKARGEVAASDSDGVRTVQGFADYAATQGLATSARVLHARVRPCTLAEADTLRVAPGAELFDLLRLRMLDGLVVVLEHNRVPHGLCPELATVDFARASLYATLRAADPPQLPRTAEYSVEARHPDADERRLLEVEETMPLLVATQLAFNQDQRPLELTTAVYRGDRYRFRASIT